MWLDTSNNGVMFWSSVFCWVAIFCFFCTVGAHHFDALAKNLVDPSLDEKLFRWRQILYVLYCMRRMYDDSSGTG